MPPATRISAMFFDRPVEYTTAIVSILCGLFIGYTSDRASVSILGNVLVAVGGVLFSWCASSTNQAQQAARVLAPSLNQLSQSIMQAISTIRYATRSLNNRSISTETAFELVDRRPCTSLMRSLSSMNLWAQN